MDGYYFISDTPPAWSLLILAATPFLLFLSLVPKIRNMRPFPRFVLQMVIVLIPLALAFWMALDQLPEAASDPSSNLYD